MIPFAIIGTSWIAEEFYAAALCSDLVLAGICSRDRERGLAFAHKLGAPGIVIYTGVEALARAENIQAVYVASPNSLHVRQSEILLRAGKHVICEKPIAVRPEQLERLQALADERGLVFMEAIMYLYTPARQAVKEALAGLGEITTAQFDFSQLSSRYHRLAAGELPNVFNPAMDGGAWNDLGIYCAYPAVDFFGEPREINAAMHMLSTGADGAGSAILKYPDKIVTLTWSKLGQSRGVSQIMGDKGTLTIRSISQFQDIMLGGDCLAAPMQKHEVMQYEARAFCDYILGRTPRVPYKAASELALRVCKLMERVRNA